MTRLSHAWRAMAGEQRLAALAALALLVTMFFPWYGLQSLNRKTGAIYSHEISAFGDVSFVEAAIFLVAVGVIAMVYARAEGRNFQLPGGDGTIATIAGGWAALLIFYRVFSRPDGGGYPVGIEWGFFLAFVAAGGLAFAGWRMRAGERPGPPLSRARAARHRPYAERSTAEPPLLADIDADATTVLPARRPPYPPAPAPPSSAPPSSSPPSRPRTPRSSDPEQLSFEDPPTRSSP